MKRILTNNSSNSSTPPFIDQPTKASNKRNWEFRNAICHKILPWLDIKMIVVEIRIYADENGKFHIPGGYKADANVHLQWQAQEAGLSWDAQLFHISINVLR